MKQYRKKPLVVEAIQYDGTNGDEVRVWSKWEIREYYRGLFVGVNAPAFSVKDGGWIIKHPDGDYFSLDNQEFKATYEPTTNCSKLEQTFRVELSRRGLSGFPVILNKNGEYMGSISNNMFRTSYDNKAYTPTELRQLADLVEETLEKGGKP